MTVEEVWRQSRVDPAGNFIYDMRGVFGCAALAVKACHASNVIAQAVFEGVGAEVPACWELVSFCLGLSRIQAFPCGGSPTY